MIKKRKFLTACPAGSAAGDNGDNGTDKAMMDLDEKIKLLKDYFSKEPSVEMAYVFGSYAKDRVMSESDFDIAVYFKPEGREIEYEKVREYPDEDRIWADVDKITGINTDLVVMNRCPSTLAFEILQTGKEIIVKDEGLRLEFYLIASSVAEDFRGFVKDFWAIEQRSASLSEQDRVKLIKRAEFLNRELMLYSIFKDLNFKGYSDDRIKQLSVERWIENIANASIDIAKIVLSSDKKKMPETYKETLKLFGVLYDFGEEKTEKLAEFAGLRNFLAHEYLDIRFEKIKRFIAAAEPLYRELIEFVNKKI
ncbi:MAG: hypothetical protein CVU78_01955 [Elusimicrobia bacterium HGW-Elusimicrobia-2]|nr:MAG: hypothetical protein CVU78_01955 [Elusimicrobia bacterium HGW-Elusimicrobia-2]